MKRRVLDAHLKRKFIGSLSTISFDSMRCSNSRQIDGRIIVWHKQTIATVIHLHSSSNNIISIIIINSNNTAEPKPP